MVGIGGGNVMAFQNDAANANLNAYQEGLSFLAPSSDCNVCFPYTINHVGEHFGMGDLDAFHQKYIDIVARSYTSRTVFKDITGKTPYRGGATRWWSKTEALVKSIYPYMKGNPHTEDEAEKMCGKLGLWLSKLVKGNIYEKSAGPASPILKRRYYEIRLQTAVHQLVADKLRAITEFAQGQDLRVFLTIYGKLTLLHQVLKDPLLSRNSEPRFLR